ncbi:hypothetical protein ABT158_32810 [Nonomuraea sp. NPDC001636]
MFISLSVFGGGEIDLRDARFAGQEIRVRAFALALFGGVRTKTKRPAAR